MCPLTSALCQQGLLLSPAHFIFVLTRTLAASWSALLPIRAHKQTQTISHTPTHPEMLEILSRGDNMFSSQSLTRSLVLSA